MSFGWPTSGIGIAHPLSSNRKSREQGIEFLKFGQASLEGIGYKEAKKRFAVSGSQAETRKSLYEETGLLYVTGHSDRITLTAIGRQLLDLLGTDPPASPGDELRRQVDTLLCWSLSNTQIDRPQSRGTPRPTAAEWRTCDVRPYATFWQAMRDLEGYVTHDEFFGELWHLHDVDDYEAAIATIRDARAQGRVLIDPSVYRGKGRLSNPRYYWMSHLSIGNTLLDVDGKAGVVRFTPEGRRIVDSVLDFQMGCAGEREAALTSRPYSGVDDYYRIAGRACPPFLASGSFRLTEVKGSRVALLEGYTVTRQGTAFILDGGPELCRLPLKTQCFHGQVPKHLLRIDAKEERGNGQVRLSMGAGRVVSNPSDFLNALNQDQDDTG